jgi:outer membrane protein TolC
MVERQSTDPGCKRSRENDCEATLAPLKQQISHTEDLLATLEGVTPSKATLPDIELTGLPLPVDLPVSLPSDLAHQRPDILSSEAELHAASANIGVATAAMFPSVSLSATYGGVRRHPEPCLCDRHQCRRKYHPPLTTLRSVRYRT